MTLCGPGPRYPESLLSPTHASSDPLVAGMKEYPIQALPPPWPTISLLSRPPTIGTPRLRDRSSFAERLPTPRPTQDLARGTNDAVPHGGGWDAPAVFAAAAD